jgi:hypothetical protein
VRSLWLSDRCGTQLLERTAKELRYTQARRAQARGMRPSNTMAKWFSAAFHPTIGIVHFFDAS